MPVQKAYPCAFHALVYTQVHLSEDLSPLHRRFPHILQPPYNHKGQAYLEFDCNTYPH